jgi:hypothetical protein
MSVCNGLSAHISDFSRKSTSTIWEKFTAFLILTFSGTYDLFLSIAYLRNYLMWHKTYWWSLNDLTFFVSSYESILEISVFLLMHCSGVPGSALTSMIFGPSNAQCFLYCFYLNFQFRRVSCLYPLLGIAVHVNCVLWYMLWQSLCIPYSGNIIGLGILLYSASDQYFDSSGGCEACLRAE